MHYITQDVKSLICVHYEYYLCKIQSVEQLDCEKGLVSDVRHTNSEPSANDCLSGRAGPVLEVWGCTKIALKVGIL